MYSLADRGPRAVAVGSTSELPDYPSTIKRIDASGMTVMPGWIDPHCHISFDEPNSNDELFFHRHQGLAAIIAAASGHRLLHAGVPSFFDAECWFQISVDRCAAIEAGIVSGSRMSNGANARLTSVGGTAERLILDAHRQGYGKLVASRDV